MFDLLNIILSLALHVLIVYGTMSTYVFKMMIWAKEVGEYL